MTVGPPPSPQPELTPEVGRGIKRGRTGEMSGRQVRPKIDWESRISTLITAVLTAPPTPERFNQLGEVLDKSDDPSMQELGRIFKQKGVITADEVTACLLKRCFRRTME